jgi:hypothetical protein
MKGIDKMEDNKIIGFNLSLNFGFANNGDYNKVIVRIENLIDDTFKDRQDVGAILLGGKAEFIRENNNLGIRKMEE